MSFSMSTLRDWLLMVTLNSAGVITDCWWAFWDVHVLSMARPTSHWPASITIGLCWPLPLFWSEVCASLCCFLRNLWKCDHLPGISWSWPVVQKPLQYEDAQTDGQHRCISLVLLTHKPFKNKFHRSFLWHILGYYTTWQVYMADEKVVFIRQGKKPLLSVQKELGQNVVFMRTRELIRTLHRGKRLRGSCVCRSLRTLQVL